RHGLYEGSLATLGRRVPLTERPETQPLAEQIDADGDDIDTGAPDHLTASYVPNVRPARAWRGIPAAAGWGQSDFQGIEGLMDALDETYSSWMRDVQNGKGRIVVPNSMLESLGPGQGALWQEERRVYQGLNMLPRAGDPDPLTVVQFEIRVEEHARTCTALIEQAVRQAGYSAATFGEQGEAAAAVTATEIRARDRRSLTTRGRKALYEAPGLADIVEALLAVEAGPRFRTGVTVERPRVEFQDSISEEPRTLAETAELLNRAEAASREVLVRLVHPDWEDDQVEEEVARLKEESTLADPVLTGAEGPPPPPGGEDDAEE
ncbi:MAG: phage portal protein, partial [Pseudonocardia sp.]